MIYYPQVLNVMAFSSSLLGKFQLKHAFLVIVYKIIRYLKSQICNSLETNLGYVFAHQGGGDKA